MKLIAETERLFIRPFNMNDIELLSTILLDAKVMKYSFRNISSRKDIKVYIQSCLDSYREYDFGQWAVINKSDLQLIGICGLNQGFNGDDSIIHINCRFAVSSWGKGLASEALKAVIQYSKNSLNLKIVYALIEPANSKSIEITKNHGFTYEKETIYKTRKLSFYKRNLIDLLES